MLGRDMQKNKKSFAIFILFVFAIIAGIAVTIYTAGFQGRDLRIKVDDVSKYQTGWFCSDKTGMYPVSVDSPELKRNGGTIVLSNILPEGLEPGTVLGIRTNHQFLNVVVDGQLVYESGAQSDIPFGSVFGKVWNLIEIPADKAGSLITLEFVSPGDRNTVDLKSAFLGNRNAAAIYLFKDNLGTALFCLFVFVLSIIFFAVYCLLSFRKLKFSYRSFAYMSLFLFLSGMWILTDSFLPQFYFRQMTWVYVLSFLTFYLLPLPVLLYVRELCPHGRKPLDILCFTGLGLFFVSTALHFTDLVEFYYSVYILHLFMMCAGSVILTVLTKEKQKYQNGDVSGLIIGFYILCGVLLTCVVLFFMGKEKLYAIAFQLGMAAFILILCYSIVKKYITVLQLEHESAIYKKIAYTDLLTHLGNRNAFEVKMQELDASAATIVVFDLNLLKSCNDSYGHSAGDDLIRGAAACIRSAFAGRGECFRIGGDEFAVIAPNLSTEDLDGCFSVLKTHLSEYNAEHLQKISIAYGSASKTEGDTDMMALFKIADKNMYDQKLSMRKCKTEEDI